MQKTRKSRLALALRRKLFVKFSRSFEQGAFGGYVLDIGPKFFLLVVQGIDDVRFNGFSCIRIADVRKLEVPHKYAGFSEAARKKLGVITPKKPSLSLASTSELLLSAQKIFPLVTLQREVVDPDVCYIGRVIEVNKAFVSLLEIGPDARWDKKPNSYRLNEITRVDFGGRYEEALDLVGGSPKK